MAAASSGPGHASMFCLDCNYALDGLNSRHCPECGRPFDPNDRGSFHRALTEALCIGRFDSAKAETLCMALEHQGIPASTVPETGGVIMYAPIPQASLWVNKRDLTRAMEIIESSSESLSRAGDRPGWTCPSCDESLDGDFDVCWNCGYVRPNE